MRFTCVSVNESADATTAIFETMTDDQRGPSELRRLSVTFNFPFPKFEPGKVYVLAMNAGGISLSEEELTDG